MESFAWWTDEQIELSKKIEKFAEEHIPRAEEAYWKKEVPWDILQKVADEGYYKVGVEKKYGGSSLGVTGACIVNEALARVSGVSTVYGTSLIAGYHQVHLFGTKEQKEKWFPRILKGELGAVALTEPFVGSDVSGTQTVAIKEGDRYIINGKKRYVTGIGIADRYMIYTKTSDNPEDIRKNMHMTAFLIEKGAPGFSVEKINELIGLPCGYNGYINFDNVEVSEENRIGEEGLGFMVAMSGLNYERTMVSSGFLGELYETVRHALWYTKRRVQFGSPTINLPTNQFKIADLIANYKIARLITYYTAFLVDQGQEPPLESSIAKLFNTEVLLKNATEAIQLMGGDGLTQFHPIGRILANAKIGQIVAGTNEIMKLLLYRLGAKEYEKDSQLHPRKIHGELGVPLPVSKDSIKKDEQIDEDKLLAVLAEDYRANPGLHMTRDDIKQHFDTDDEELNSTLELLEEKNLVALYRHKFKGIQLAKATYPGLHKANPPEYYRWFPSWVELDKMF